MIRPFLFMAGEFRVTQPMVFRNDEWSHTMVSKRMTMNVDGSFHRGNNFAEKLRGIIIHASVEDENLRRDVFQFIIDNNIPCFPDPKILLELDDRHVVMKKCIEAGLVPHKVIQIESGNEISLPYPFVVKTGNDHRGEGKFLVRNAQELPQWNGIATIEPYFEGISCRVLMVGEQTWGIRYDNDQSWIKNSAGAELSMWPEIPEQIVAHAKKVKALFGLEVCGIDYVASENGEGHFLEYNQFPGLDVDDSVTPHVVQFFEGKMKWVAQTVKS